MALECHAIILDLPQSRKGEYLESTGICKYIPIPVREFMQPAEIREHFGAWPEV